MVRLLVVALYIHTKTDRTLKVIFLYDLHPFLVKPVKLIEGGRCAMKQCTDHILRHGNRVFDTCVLRLDAREDSWPHVY